MREHLSQVFVFYEDIFSLRMVNFLGFGFIRRYPFECTILINILREIQINQ